MRALIVAVALTVMVGVSAVHGRLVYDSEVEAASESAVVTPPAEALTKDMPGLCATVIAEGQIRPDFTGMIAHATHSLNLEAVQHFFEPKATSFNRIPVVNPDLLSDTPILGNAPSLGVNNTFRFFALNQVDWVMSHMGEKKYDMGTQYGLVERLMHQLHMMEVWMEAGTAYQALIQAPPTPNVCACLTDIDNNGVMKLLRFIALQVREPELMLGRHTTVNGATTKWSGNIYKYNFKSNMDDVLTAQEVLPKLDSAQNWKAWKDLMASMKDHGSQVVAQYLYCLLQSGN